MRKHLVWVLALALAVGVAAVAMGANTQGIKVQVGPAKVANLPKKNLKTTIMRTITTTNCVQPCSGAGAIKPVTKAQVWFDNDIVFNTKGIPTCPKNKLLGTTPEQAKANCPKAVVGSGQAIVGIAGDPSPGAQVTSPITAFNGPKKGGKDVIFLHVRTDAIASTIVLTGVLNKVKGDYGNRLDVAVPPLPAGSATKVFDVSVGGGLVTQKHVHYVSAHCGDSNKTLNFKGKFTYSGGEPTKNVSSTQKCKVA
jgi:hypothetical protein